MKNLKRFYSAIFLGACLGVLFLDLVTKYLAAAGVMKQHVIIDGIFYLAPYQKNTGVAFGLNLPMWIQIAGSAVILFLLVRFGFENILNDKKLSYFKFSLLGIIAGGGFGNLLERIINGYVVDFIVLWPFPVFNVADIGITVGIILLFGTMILSSKTKN